MESKSDICLDEFFTQIYLPNSKALKRSWRLDERISRKYLSPVFGRNSLREISPAMAAEWFYSLSARGLALSTCNRILAVFRAIISMAFRLGFTPDKFEIFKNIKPHKIKLFRQRTLSREEASKLILALKEDSAPAARALLLLIYTGARKSEILRAKWENVDFEKRALIVPVSKSGKAREIILPKEAVRILYELKRNGGIWLFPGRNNKCLSDIFYYWSRLRKRLGLEGMRIHDLRHSFASFLVSSGGSLYEAQALLGHANPRTTVRYASISTESRIRAVERVMECLEPKNSPGFAARLRRAAACALRFFKSFFSWRAESGAGDKFI